MRILFLGSDRFACPSVDAVSANADDNLVGIVTQPAQPTGRRRELTPCPLHAHLLERDLPIAAPENVNSPLSLDTIRLWEPDLMVVVAYGQILKRELLEIPPQGWGWNRWCAIRETGRFLARVPDKFRCFSC